MHCVVVIDDMEYVICNPRMMSKQALEGRNLKACVVSIDVLRQMMISRLKNGRSLFWCDTTGGMASYVRVRDRYIYIRFGSCARTRA